MVEETVLSTNYCLLLDTALC
uniref:Uncharacterized protein n=1 Tax=Rhizophora mucronata TaxID=61149 RepID=A0A2P2KU81_RHIMU